MYALRLRKPTPLSSFLRCPSLRQRAFSSSHVAASEELEPCGTKFLESFKEEFEIGSRIVSIESGEIARFANGAVVLGMDHTNVLSTVTSAKGDGVRDFLPLTVEYQEKQFAQGMIPTTFMRREGAPKERELLCGRLIDRPIRPLFPRGFYHEVQVMATVLTSDGKHDPDVMAANATSAALMLSDIPWAGPIGVIRVGRIDGAFIVNPTMDELDLSDLNLVYACTKDKTLMIDVQACEISEKDLEAGLRLAHPEAVKFLEPQIRLAAKAGKQKKDYTLSMVSDRTLEKVSHLAEAKIEAVFTDPSYGKFERGEALDEIGQEVKRTLEEECDEESLKVLPKVVDTVRKQVVRKRIIEEGFRVDGRHLDEVRPVYCKAGRFPSLHGSALFSRGDTQVLCTVTLGAPGDAQRLDSLVGPSTKRFMLHYSFPPYSINEVGKRGGLNRREVGHGTLAEKALLAVLPPEDTFLHTIRVNSEVMASDGSTSMASVCGGSMALMDAGIPLREHVAGVSVGLVSEVDPSTGAIKDYRILTDILGLEDHLGDMDFKIAGTRKGVTAIQLDIKPAGIPLDIICESLEHARKGRLQILDHMEHEIGAPRLDRNDRRIVSLKYSNEALRRLIGPQGVLKRKIEEETGARISISDETLTIVAKNQDVMEKVQEKIDFMIGREIQVGGIYKGVVTSVKEYGAFVEFNGGQQGLLHVSELSHDRVSKVSDVISVGQQLSLMCIEQDVRGNIKLSLKATLPKPVSESVTNNAADGSVNVMKEMTNVSVGSVSEVRQDHKHMEDKLQVNNVVEPLTSFTPAVLIRSAAECDEEEEKLESIFERGSNVILKTVKVSRGDQKRKKFKLYNDVESKGEASVSAKTRKIGSKVASKARQTRKHGSVVELLDATEGDEDERSEGLSQDAAVCDEEEKLPSVFEQGSNVILKTTKVSRGNQKLKKFTPSNDVKSKGEASVSAKTQKIGSKVASKAHKTHKHGSVVELLDATEGDEDERSEDLSQGSNVNSTTCWVSNGRSQKQKKDLPSSDDEKSKLEGSVSAKNLKIGSNVTAKVCQIRTHGLVLELGGGIRGMYKFESNGKRDFEIGDELQVKCSSFSSKGVPVMSLASD